MKNRILAGFLAVLLMAVCVLAIPAPAASAQEPEAEETVAEPEQEAAEEAKPSAPPVSAEKPTVPEISDPLPDVDIHSWEFMLCNSYNSRGWLTCQRGNLEGIGIDERIREHLITREISVGDFVVSGGEIPAALLADSIIRLIPGVLTDETSALSDSFQDGLVSPPVYTRPAEFNGWKVPDVLLSGDPKKIKAWQDGQALERTKLLRPNLLED